MAEQATVHRIGGSQPQSKKTKAGNKPKPTEALPSDRLTIVKQLGILRAYAAASGQAAKPVKTGEVGAIAKIQPTTISAANPFFVATGLIQRIEGGFVPSAEVMSFAHAYEWNSADTTASHKIAPLIANTWFAKEILKKIQYHSQLKESEAVRELANLAAAPQEYKLRVKVLIDYLEVSGLVQRDGEYLRRGSVVDSATAPAPAVASASASPSSEAKESVLHRDPVGTRSGLASAFSHVAGGSIQFNVSVRVDMTEFKGWQPERIAAFFAGMAQVLAAKGALEKNVSEEE
jgi:hypothetical protein